MSVQAVETRERIERELLDVKNGWICLYRATGWRGYLRQLPFVFRQLAQILENLTR